jgi:hypothetical protein
VASHFASKQPEVKESSSCNKIKMVLDALKFAETPQLQGNYNDSYCFEACNIVASPFASKHLEVKNRSNCNKNNTTPNARRPQGDLRNLGLMHKKMQKKMKASEGLYALEMG